LIIRNNATIVQAIYKAEAQAKNVAAEVRWTPQEKNMSAKALLGILSKLPLKK
jgi:hypothetical protein